MHSITDIKHAFYINLTTRPDRKQHVETQLNMLGITAERFNAIKLPNGALGCSMSHLKCLEMAKANSWPHLLIVEDDIKFLNPQLFKSQLNLFLSNHKSWDVVLIGGNNIPPYTKIDDTCVKVSTCQTTTGYLVNSHYFDILIDNFRTGILQKRDNWFLIIPLTVTQREDYSDIEKRPTNYTNAMIDLDKEAFLRAQHAVNLDKQYKANMGKIKL
jgi:hypothetical protein